jgi:hypothetical protein
MGNYYYKTRPGITNARPGVVIVFSLENCSDTLSCFTAVLPFYSILATERTID